MKFAVIVPQGNDDFYWLSGRSFFLDSEAGKREVFGNEMDHGAG
jgi:hypothetical protein